MYTLFVMLRRPLLIIAIVVVVAALGIGGYWLFTYYREYKILSDLPVIVVDRPNLPPGTNTNTQPAPDPSKDTAETSVFFDVTVTDITPSSISVTTATGKSKTFSVPGAITMYSFVSVGQTGRGYGDIEPGMLITVYPDKYDSSRAANLAFALDPSLKLTKEDALHSVNGTVTGLSSTTITITPQGSAPVTVVREPSTPVFAYVRSGQTASAIGVGDSATASGLVSAGGKTTAKSIIFISAGR